MLFAALLAQPQQPLMKCYGQKFKSRLHALVFKAWPGVMQQLHLVWDCKQKCSARERQTVLSLVKQHFMMVRVSLEYALGWVVLFQERSV